MTRYRIDLDDWIHPDRGDCSGDACKPVFVIDPEDERACYDLANALTRYGVQRDGGTRPVRGALRMLITPPKPDEPTGLGAVVEDERGVVWVRTQGGRWVTTLDLSIKSTSWTLLSRDVVRVLSEGWSE